MADEVPYDVYTWLRSRRTVQWVFSKRGAWLVAILVGATFFLIFNCSTGNLSGGNVVEDYRLATQGRITLGTVTGLQPSDHAGCGFTYRVAGTAFSGYEEGCGAGRTVGSPIKITYLPSNPQVSTTGDPASEFWQELLLAYGMPVVFAVFVYFGWKWFAQAQDLRYPRDSESAISGRFPATDSWILHSSIPDALRIGRKAIESVGGTHIMEPQGGDFVYGWVGTKHVTVAKWADYQLLVSASQGPREGTTLTCSVRPAARIPGSGRMSREWLRRITTEIDARRGTPSGGA